MPGGHSDPGNSATLSRRNFPGESRRLTPVTQLAPSSCGKYWQLSVVRCANNVSRNQPFRSNGTVLKFMLCFSQAISVFFFFAMICECPGNIIFNIKQSNSSCYGEPGTKSTQSMYQSQTKVTWGDSPPHCFAPPLA